MTSQVWEGSTGDDSTNIALQLLLAVFALGLAIGCILTVISTHWMKITKWTATPVLAEV